MKRKKAPRLAAAFVVTISAGCGGATQEPAKPDPQTSGPENQDWVPNLGSVREGFRRNEDGTCTITHAANPPWVEPVDCETQKPLKKPEEASP
ncbi:hypothetical protein [Polyangium fumosum]|uniref:Secreted protein n=1 Tax=Polyangium fumosum TaxID=889272 RepID=A0A4U1IBA9_9BACT|nr:hypothetical protein [Polyangium fumosum]TKC90767.1 hypothetical protein E8A74_50750 [Polyangium fumosum]